MRYLISICIFFWSLITVSAEDMVWRVEGQYTAMYQFETEKTHGDSWQTGTVIYYAAPCKKGKPSTKYETYPEREWGTVKGDSINDRPLGCDFVFALFWPKVGTCGEAGPDSVVTVGDTLVCYTNVADRFSEEDKKGMRTLGFSSDISEAELISKYLGTESQPADVGNLVSSSVHAELTGRGKWFRWTFQAPETKLHVNIDIDVTSIAKMTAKEAKAARKRENAAYKQAHKKK